MSESNITGDTFWAAISPENKQTKRRFIDHSSLSYTRKGAIEKHCEPQQDVKAIWAKQKARGWTVEKVRLEALS